MLHDLVPIVLFAAGFGVVFVYLMTRHREKMYLMEHRLDRDEYGAELFGSIHQTLKVGILAIGLAVGLGAAYAIEENTHLDTDFTTPICLLFFGGLSLVVHYLLQTGRFER